MQERIPEGIGERLHPIFRDTIWGTDLESEPSEDTGRVDDASSCHFHEGQESGRDVDQTDQVDTHDSVIVRQCHPLQLTGWPKNSSVVHDTPKSCIVEQPQIIKDSWIF